MNIHFDYEALIRYIRATIKHKKYVYKFGRELKVPILRLLKHDLSKFGISEVFGYSRHFYGDKKDPHNFSLAWIHHQNTNPHHWEYWIPRTNHTLDATMVPMEPYPMPETYVREMLADWLGASMSYEGKAPTSFTNWVWLKNNLHKMKLHPQTKKTLLKVASEYFNDASENTFDLWELENN